MHKIIFYSLCFLLDVIEFVGTGKLKKKKKILSEEQQGEATTSKIAKATIHMSIDIKILRFISNHREKFRIYTMSLIYRKILKFMFVSYDLILV